MFWFNSCVHFFSTHLIHSVYFCVVLFLIFLVLVAKITVPSKSKNAFTGMRRLGRKGIHYLHKLNATNVPASLLEKGQNRVIDASLTLIRERAMLKVSNGYKLAVLNSIYVNALVK